MKNTKSNLTTAGSYRFANPSDTQTTNSEKKPAELPSQSPAQVLFLDLGHKLVRRHAIDSAGGGYEGL